MGGASIRQGSTRVWEREVNFSPKCQEIKLGDSTRSPYRKFLSFFLLSRSLACPSSRSSESSASLSDVRILQGHLVYTVPKPSPEQKARTKSVEWEREGEKTHHRSIWMKEGTINPPLRERERSYLGGYLKIPRYRASWALSVVHMQLHCRTLLSRRESAPIICQTRAIHVYIYPLIRCLFFKRPT